MQLRTLKNCDGHGMCGLTGPGHGRQGKRGEYGKRGEHGNQSDQSGQSDQAR